METKTTFVGNEITQDIQKQILGLKAEVAGIRQSLVLLVSFMVAHIGLEEEVMSKFGMPVSEDLKNLAKQPTDDITPLDPVDSVLPNFTPADIENVLGKLIESEIVRLAPEVLVADTVRYDDNLNQAVDLILDYQWGLTDVPMDQRPDSLLQAGDKAVVLLGTLETHGGLTFKTRRRINDYLDMVLGAQPTLTSEG